MGFRRQRRVEYGRIGMGITEWMKMWNEERVGGAKVREYGVGVAKFLVMNFRFLLENKEKYLFLEKYGNEF